MPDRSWRAASARDGWCESGAWAVVMEAEHRGQKARATVERAGWSWRAASVPARLGWGWGAGVDRGTQAGTPAPRVGVPDGRGARLQPAMAGVKAERGRWWWRPSRGLKARATGWRAGRAWRAASVPARLGLEPGSWLGSETAGRDACATGWRAGWSWRAASARDGWCESGAWAVVMEAEHRGLKARATGWRAGWSWRRPPCRRGWGWSRGAGWDRRPQAGTPAPRVGVPDGRGARLQPAMAGVKAERGRW